MCVSQSSTNTDQGNQREATGHTTAGVAWKLSLSFCPRAVPPERTSRVTLTFIMGYLLQQVAS